MRAAADPNAAVATDPSPRRAPADGVWPLVLLALVAVALRLLWIERPAWNDAEASTWQAVTQPWSGPGGFTTSPHSTYPLVHLLLRWLCGAGVLPSLGEGWLRLPFAFVGALSVPLLALLARRFVGPVPALFAAAIVALHPAHIAWSQTADPASVAVLLATVVGLVAARRPLLAGAIVVLAGASHPIGWIAGCSWWFAARSPRRGNRASPWWRGGRLALAALALPAGLSLVGELRAAMLLCVACGVAATPSRALRLVVPTLLPLAIGGATMLTGGVLEAPLLAACTPALAILAGVGVEAARRHLLALPIDGGWARRFAAAVPLLALAGELSTTSFLHFTIYRSGHPPWRDAARAALRTVQPGGGLVVFAGEGARVLQAYLRPNHWRDSERDLHPGCRVELLQAGQALAGQLGEPFPAGGVLVLSEPELVALRKDPPTAAALARFAVRTMLSCPQPLGDHSLYLLLPRAPQ